MKPETWAQIKNITADILLGAIEKDGGILILPAAVPGEFFPKGLNLISIHYHPHKSYGPDMLRDLIRDLGWTEKDLKRLKLIK
jgi:hypothetical protein